MDSFPPPSCPSDSVVKAEFVAAACHELHKMKIAANPGCADALAVEAEEEEEERRRGGVLLKDLQK